MTAVFLFQSSARALGASRELMSAIRPTVVTTLNRFIFLCSRSAIESDQNGSHDRIWSAGGTFLELPGPALGAPALMAAQSLISLLLPLWLRCAGCSLASLHQ